MKFKAYGTSSAFPNKNPTSGYLLETEQEKILIDIGSGVLLKLLEDYSITDIDYVLISHFHHDHMSDLGVLLYAKLLAFDNKPLHIYAPKNKYYEEEIQNTPNCIFHPIENYMHVENGTWKLDFLQTNHPVETYAIRIQSDDKTFVYTADSACFDEFVSFSKNCDLLLTECSFFERPEDNFGHLCADDLIQWVKKITPKKILLTHLPHTREQELLDYVTVRSPFTFELAKPKKVEVI